MPNFAGAPIVHARVEVRDDFPVNPLPGQLVTLKRGDSYTLVFWNGSEWHQVATTPVTIT